MKISLSHNGGFYTGCGGCLTRLILLSIAVMVGAWLLPGVTVTSFWTVLLTAIAISVLDNILRPVLIVITLPVTALTLGLFLFVINAIIIVVASGIVSGFHVENFGSAMLFSLVLMGVNYLLELPNKYLDRKPLERQPTTDTTDDGTTDDEGFTPYEEIKD